MSGGDPPGITFRAAVAADLGAVQAVGVRAALRFVDVGWPSVAASTPTGGRRVIGRALVERAAVRHP